MRTSRARLAVMSLSLIAAGMPLGAQATTELQPGARVRVQAPGVVAGAYTGTVLARRGDTLVLGSPTSTPVSVPIGRVTSLEVSRGKSRSLGALSGLKWGTPIGLGLGLALVPAINNCVNCNKGEAPSVVLLYGVSGAIYGAGIGALIGKERWERFALPATGTPGGGTGTATAAWAGAGARSGDAIRRASDQRSGGSGGSGGFATDSARTGLERDALDSAAGKLLTRFPGRGD